MTAAALELLGCSAPSIRAGYFSRAFPVLVVALCEAGAEVSSERDDGGTHLAVQDRLARPGSFPLPPSAEQNRTGVSSCPRIL